MPELEALQRRVEVLEQRYNDGLADAVGVRHTLRNELHVIVLGIDVRLRALEGTLSSIEPRAKTAWLQWALGVAGAVLLLMAGILLKGKP